MTAFWLRSFLMLAVLLNALTASSAGVGSDATSGVLMNHEAVAKNNVESANNSKGYLVDHIARDKRHTIAQNNMPKIQLDSTTNLEASLDECSKRSSDSEALSQPRIKPLVVT